MPSVLELLTRSIHSAARVSPALAGDLAYHLFFTTSPRMPVRETDAATLDDARLGSLRVRGIDVSTYEWGRGPRTVLLLHGWRGRASQFAPLVRELVAEGFRVLAFDAPAHGTSGGGRTDVRDWVDAAEQLHAARGPFAAIVGHSFGAFAALTIARSTVPADAVVAIAGAAGPDAFVAEFAKELGLDPATIARLSERFRRRLDLDQATISARYDAARHPLPARTALMVIHDRDDRRMPDSDSLRLHAAHGERSRLLRTEGLGHTRVLSADATLDAVVALVTGGLEAVDALGSTAPGATQARRRAPRRTTGRTAAATTTAGAPEPSGRSATAGQQRPPVDA